MGRIKAKSKPWPQGSALSEYALLTGLISVVAISAVYATGEKVSSIFDTGQQALSDSIPGTQIPGAVTLADLYDGVDQTGWLIGTPAADFLQLSTEPGVKGLAGDDDLRGTSGASYEQFIGGPGDDVIDAKAGESTVYFAQGDGHDLVKVAGVNDRLRFMDVDLNAVTASRIDESYFFDLVLTLDGTGDSVRIRNFAATNTANFIDQYDFVDQTVFHEDMRAKSIADQKSTGIVLGTWTDDVYPISRTDNDLLIKEYDGTDQIIFAGLNQDDVKFRNLSDFTLEAVTKDNHVYTLRKGFYSDVRFVVESFVFDDGTLDFQGAIDKQDVDAKTTGAVLGTQHEDHYVVDPLDASFTIQEFNSPGDTDTITFRGLDLADVQFLNNADNSLIVRLPGGQTVTIFDMFEYNDWGYIEELIFDDQTIDPLEAIYKMDEDSKLEGYIHGASRGDRYTVTMADPSFTIDEWGSQTSPDTIAFDTAIGAWGFNRSGDDLILRDGLREITVKRFFNYMTAGHIENWVFSDVTLTYQEVLDNYT